jgi:hypothetical protein
MQLGMIGLGRMGANMVRRLIENGHDCVVFDMSPKAVEELAKEKAIGASSLANFVNKLAKPRGVADGACGGRGPDHCRPRAASAIGRYPDRRRQFLLCRRHSSCESAHAQGNPLRGRRNERRCVGPRTRLLYDDR